MASGHPIVQQKWFLGMHCAADTMGMESISVGFSLESVKGGTPGIFQALSRALLLALKTPKPASKETGNDTKGTGFPSRTVNFLCRAV